MAVSDTLLADAKNYLDITWEMTNEEVSKLKGQIARGKAYITDKTGMMDFEADGQPKELLFNYLLYDRAGALNEFRENYMPNIIGLQLQKEVEDYETASTD